MTATDLLKLCPPLLLALLELGHPRDTVADLAALIRIADWWLLLHLVQLPLFWLVARSVARRLKGWPGSLATVGRLAIAVFAVSVTVLDGVAGIAAGLIAHFAAAWPHEQQIAAARQFQALFSGPLIGTRLAVVDVVVATSWLIAMCAAAVILAAAGRPCSALGLTLVAGLALWYGGHAAPFGPIAFGSVFVTELVLLNGSRRPEPPIHRPEVLE